ncbi:uncharacterized protein [Drosophila tropicalis]|uniref:uncharacterized protein n=1 Tax=Drosophila tropicalis TaxID=46794 RepID=UPI0035AC1666
MPSQWVRKGNGSGDKSTGGEMDIIPYDLNNKYVQFVILILACTLLGCARINASYAPGTVLDIQLGEAEVEQFKYIPTRDGYEFGYTLPNGAHRDEVAKVLSGTSAAKDLENANELARNHRPSRTQGLKNRKLSGKSLSSLAG